MPVIWHVTKLIHSHGRGPFKGVAVKERFHCSKFSSDTNSESVQHEITASKITCNQPHRSHTNWFFVCGMFESQTITYNTSNLPPPVEFSRNTQSWQCWHFCTTSNGNELETVKNWIRCIANLYLSRYFKFKLKWLIPISKFFFQI